MNIDNHFYSAGVYLEMAKKKFSLQDYEGAIAALAKSYSHNRELLTHVLAVIDLKVEVDRSADEVPG